MSNQPFDLRALTLETLRESGTADLKDVTKAVLAKIPRGSTRAALEQALYTFVVKLNSEDRMRHPVSVTAAAAATEQHGETAPEQHAETPNGRPSVKSWKRDALKMPYWRKRLRDRYSVANGWKFLEDCGHDDFVYIAEHRRDLAARNTAVAEEAEKFDAAVQEHGVARFGDLPEDVQQDLLGGTS